MLFQLLELQSNPNLEESTTNMEEIFDTVLSRRYPTTLKALMDPKPKSMKGSNSSTISIVEI